MNFYKLIKWKNRRESTLKRDEYLCRECRRFGKSTQATTVHHVIPLEERPELGLNIDNLISLCTKCHGKMHDRITNKLTVLGEWWVDKLSPLLSNKNN